jgi:hypothetical protein
MSDRAFLRAVPAAIVAALLLLFGGTVPAAASPASVHPHALGSVQPDATGSVLRTTTGMYPRVVRLAHSGSANGQLIASVVGFDAAGGVGAIYRSTDDGATFTQIGAIHDPETATGLARPAMSAR